MQNSYDAGVTDEFVEPVVCAEDGAITRRRQRHLLQLPAPTGPGRSPAPWWTRTLTASSASEGFFPLHFVCTTEYDATMPNVYGGLPPPEAEATPSASISAKLGLTQLRIAETEKYAHVTFFFNGGVEKVFPGEDRALIPSPKVATYDLKPEMSAHEVTDEAVRAHRERQV